jgi:hypothetical protein
MTGPTIIQLGPHGRLILNSLGDGTTSMTLERGGSGITAILDEEKRKQAADALCRLICDCELLGSCVDPKG